MKLMIKIFSGLQNICIAAKISVMTGTVLSIVMYTVATAMSFSGVSIPGKYLYEAIAKVATDVFAIGVFCGLVGDIFASAVDRNRK